MVDNFDLITPLLQWRSKDDFYFIQILQRKKDHKGGMKVSGANNNARLIKAYYLQSLEQLEFYKPEIIELCKVFNARAGINLNRRSFRKTHIKFLRKIVDQMENESFDKAYKAYPSVVGANAQDNEKKWIIDVDKDDIVDGWNSALMTNFLNTLQPHDGRTKTIAVIPSKTGQHLITRPFNLMDFHKKYPNMDVQKDNPTNLYIP